MFEYYMRTLHGFQKYVVTIKPFLKKARQTGMVRFHCQTFLLITLSELKNELFSKLFGFVDEFLERFKWLIH